MTRQKTTLAIVAATVLLLFTAGLRADTHGAGSNLTGGAVITSHGGFGVWIGSAPTPPPHRFPPHRQIVVGGPWWHRTIRIGPPPVVIVGPPVERPVVVRPAPPVEDREIMVWVTNSNGSKTSVKLAQRGRWYIGPRGEYYDEMPTNEQLRVVYGF
jgi:hypothetical protein